MFVLTLADQPDGVYSVYDEEDKKVIPIFQLEDDADRYLLQLQENISYPNNPNFYIMDLGKGRRKYSPLRILQEAAYDLNNEDLMIMSDKQFKDMIDHVKKEIK